MSGTGRTTCPWYEEVDAILGTRAASCPPVVLDSGVNANSAPSPGSELAQSDEDTEQSSELCSMSDSDATFNFAHNR